MSILSTNMAEEASLGFGFETTDFASESIKRHAST